MEHDSQIKYLESQIRECYGRVIWTHKTHEKCADILLRRHGRIKIAQIALSAVSTTGILIAVFGNIYWVGIASASITALLFGLNTYTKDYDLGEIAQKHSSTASILWDIREKYLSLLTDIKANIYPIEKIKEKRDELQEELFNVYKGSTRTISKAYKEASKALKFKEDMTFSDKEIDMLLPKELRKNYSE